MAAFTGSPASGPSSFGRRPGEDGYTLIRRLRGRGGPLASTPAIALSAYARPEDAERSLAAGFQLHLAKPIDSNVLVASVARLAASA